MPFINPPQDYTRYDYNTRIPSGQNLQEYWNAVMQGEGANTANQGFEALAIYLAPYMPFYENLTPNPQS